MTTFVADCGDFSRDQILACEQFLKFCRDSDIVQAEHFLNHGLTNINAQDEDGLTPLQVTAAYGHLELTETLLNNGAEVDMGNNYGFTPLHHACLNGNSELIALLLKYGSDIECRNYCGASALFLASKRGHLDAVKILVEHGAEVEPDEDDCFFECSPLIIAVANDHENVARFLIENGANVNRVIESTGYTPLMYAALKAQLTLVQLLLDRGSNMEARNALNKTAMDLALTRRCNDVIALLEQCTAQSRSRSNTLVSSLDQLDIIEAVKLEEAERVLEIIKADQSQADYVKTDDGCTPLILASMLGRLDLVRLLLNNGAQIDRRDKLKGWTALMQACFFRKVPVAKFLIRAGADVNIKSDDGYTALDLAIIADYANVPEDGLLALLSQKSIEQDLTLSLNRTNRSYSLPRKRSLMNFLAKKLRSPSKTSRNFSKPKVWWNKFKNRLKSRTNSMTSLNTLNRVSSPNGQENCLFIDPSRSILNTSFFFGSTKEVWKSQSVYDLQQARCHVPSNHDQILGSNTSTLNFEHIKNKSGIVLPPFHPAMTFGPVDPKTNKRTLPTPILSNLARHQNLTNENPLLKNGTSLNALDWPNTYFNGNSNKNDPNSASNTTINASNNCLTQNTDLNLDMKLNSGDTVASDFGGFRSLAMYNASRMRPAKRIPHRISPMHKYENIMAALNLPPTVFQSPNINHQPSPNSSLSLSTTSSLTLLMPNGHQPSPSTASIGAPSVGALRKRMPYVNASSQQGPVISGAAKKRNQRCISRPHSYHDAVSDNRMYNTVGPSATAMKNRGRPNVAAIYMRPHSYHDPDNLMLQNCLNFNNLPITPTRKSTFQFLNSSNADDKMAKFNSTPQLLASSPNESSSGSSLLTDKNKRLSQLTANLSNMSNKFSSTDTLKLDEEHMDFVLKQIAAEPYSSVFDDEELDLDTFVTLTDGDLRDMGIQDPGPRNEILKLVRQVNCMIQKKKRTNKKRQHEISESHDPLLIPLD